VGRGSLAAVRLTEFWHRMDTAFGATYSRSIATDQVLPTLGGRTVDQALAAGEDAKWVWRAVCAALEVPAAKR
jgi:hypothetical protein